MNDGCVYGGTLRDAKREPLATRSGFFCNLSEMLATSGILRVAQYS